MRLAGGRRCPVGRRGPRARGGGRARSRPAGGHARSADLEVVVGQAPVSAERDDVGRRPVGARGEARAAFSVAEAAQGARRSVDDAAAAGARRVPEPRRRCRERGENGKTWSERERELLRRGAASRANSASVSPGKPAMRSVARWRRGFARTARDASARIARRRRCRAASARGRRPSPTGAEDGGAGRRRARRDEVDERLAGLHRLERGEPDAAAREGRPRAARGGRRAVVPRSLPKAARWTPARTTSGTPASPRRRTASSTSSSAALRSSRGATGRRRTRSAARSRPGSSGRRASGPGRRALQRPDPRGHREERGRARRRP